MQVLSPEMSTEKPLQCVDPRPTLSTSQHVSYEDLPIKLNTSCARGETSNCGPLIRSSPLELDRVAACKRLVIQRIKGLTVALTD